MVEVIRGTDGDNLFHAGDNTLTIGGLGNDTYYLWSPTAQVVEQAGEGYDTLHVGYWGAYIMPEGFEAMYMLSWAGVAATGNSSANLIQAGGVMTTVNGKGGDDVLYGGASADVFVVERGNGSDTLIGFVSGFDTIRLEGYSFASFADIAGKARQDGANLVIDLGGGERLTLADVTLVGLQAADFGYSSVGTPAPAGLTLMDGIATVAMNGLYVHNNAWGAGELKEGVDFFIDSTYDKNDFAKATTFRWDFPTTTDPYAPVRGYPELFFGAAPWGDTINAADTTRTFPVQLSDVSALTTSWDTSIAGSTGSFNVAYDIWLTDVPNGGPGNVTNEIMIWTHAHEHQPWGEKVGTWEYQGVTAEIWNMDVYTAVILGETVLAGEIDLLDLFARLGELGIVSPDEWLASVHFGAEIIGGAGEVTISGFDVKMTAADDAGVQTTTRIDGTGAHVLEVVEPARPDDGAGEDTSAMVAVHDAFGLVTGYISEGKDAVGDPLIRHYDLGGVLTGWDIISTAPEGHVFTKHFTAGGVQIGWDASFVQADGLALAAYDATATLTSYAREIWHGDDSKESLVYDRQWQVTGRTVELVRGDVTTVHAYDAAGALTGSTVTTRSGSFVARIDQLDADGKLTGYQLSEVDRTGVLTVRSFDGAGQHLGAVQRWVQDDGITVQADYDARWHLTGRTYHGTGGDDTLQLGVGHNELFTGGGRDTVTASHGTDIFHVTDFGADDILTVIGFKAGQDKLVLELGSGEARMAGNSGLVYDAASGLVLFDSDGPGGAAGVAVAQLEANLQLGAGDLLLG
ncbi:hypothetical protein V5740_09270 [Croceibacterium sp. TMG7-5b_MA50]|uniref:GH12 family glycosyl hydrolase domain-containing protein n=1 Tax=Croceibacterium sp. TMG7-5b_MA50 TaxID=3121290 RepID=UPI0032218129